MDIYQLTIIEKDEKHIPAIEKFADMYEAIYSDPMETKDGIVYEFEFPSYQHTEEFKAKLDTLRPKLF